MSTDALLNVADLTASVDEKTILHQVSLSVAAGETHVLMGPNGAGKSTMGHVIMGDPAYTVDSGSIAFDGADITELTCDKRSRAGLFLSFQAPVEIPGVPLSSFLPATIGYQVPDPECDLDIVPNVGREADVRYALSNSLGFGGHNASILLKKWEG